LGQKPKRRQVNYANTPEQYGLRFGRDELQYRFQRPKIGQKNRTNLVACLIRLKPRDDQAIAHNIEVDGTGEKPGFKSAHRWVGDGSSTSLANSTFKNSFRTT